MQTQPLLLAQKQCLPRSHKPPQQQQQLLLLQPTQPLQAQAVRPRLHLLT
jgi:hypothetical protein